MKQPEELRPELEAKFGKLGNGFSLLVPKWFVEQWQMNPGKRYRILVEEEVCETKGLKTEANSINKMAVSLNLVRVSPPFSEYISNNIPSLENISNF
jgi:hypothetical protein